MVGMMGDGASEGAPAPRGKWCSMLVTTRRNWGGLEVISGGAFPKGTH